MFGTGCAFPKFGQVFESLLYRVEQAWLFQFVLPGMPAIRGHFYVRRVCAFRYASFASRLPTAITSTISSSSMT